jgi:cobalt/nickel transport protein
MKRFAIVVLALAIALGVAVSPLASKSPDGLNKVAQDHGFAARATSEGSYDGLAGFTGTLLVFALGYGVVKVARRR